SGELKSGNNTILILQATLTERGAPLSFRLGGMKGLMVDVQTNKVVYGVIGGWKGTGDAKNGAWDVKIFRLSDGKPVGTASGVYVDPEPHQTGGGGEFKGTFTITN